MSMMSCVSCDVMHYITHSFYVFLHGCLLGRVALPPRGIQLQEIIEGNRGAHLDCDKRYQPLKGAQCGWFTADEGQHQHQSNIKHSVIDCREE